ncbi:hypothetical protein C0Q70_16726 [Pomacea canaliculata]|uniref:Uncharacterized protein n=1 Tax=Pomacea canaliculata TaxID=400727 RepID=A0A2T7NQK6_POMCA|nr:hypothetical protein C0Q70_16726 [Pomacea canaliculata]
MLDVGRAINSASFQPRNIGNSRHVTSATVDIHTHPTSPDTKIVTHHLPAKGPDDRRHVYNGYTSSKYSVS